MGINKGLLCNFQHRPTCVGLRSLVAVGRVRPPMLPKGMSVHAIFALGGTWGARKGLRHGMKWRPIFWIPQSPAAISSTSTGAKNNLKKKLLKHRA